jgi:hypothetical protein
MRRAAALFLLVGGTVVVGLLTHSLLVDSRDPARATSASLTDAVATACTAALALSWAWFVLATVTCLVDELTAPSSAAAGEAGPRRAARRQLPPSAARRLARVLAGSGLACLAAPCLPAAHALTPVDLPLPTRQLGATAGAREDTAPQPPPRRTGTHEDAGSVVVGSGDSLWSIAAARLGPHASTVAVDEEWRRLYARNRSVVGPDPDLIHPGTRLRTS